MTESDIRTKVLEVVSALDTSLYEIARGDNSLCNQFSRQIKGSTHVSADTILQILERIPTLSAEWLLRGRGRMFHNTDPLSISITQTGGIGNTANTGTMPAASPNRADAPLHTDAEYSALERENIQLRAQLELMKQLFTQKTL